MTPQDFKELYTKELDNLFKEISACEEDKLWKISGDIKNTPGNLCLHLLGNINHNIGALLGKTGYVRKREDEFSLKNIPKEKLLSDIAKAKAMAEDVLTTLDPSELTKNWPVEMFGKPDSTEHILTYFFGHLMYHIGQINYGRRLM
jgi:uncharacterized damage-inducible protein DinB